MSVTNCVLRQRKGKQTLAGGKRVRTYQAIYHIKCNSINEDPVTIMAYTGLPQLADAATWPTDAGALLVDVDPQQDMEKPDFWVVTCNYTSNPDIRQPDDVDPEENPLLRPCVVERSPVQRQRILERDVENEWIVNTAGEFFNPPVEREEHPPGYILTKNMLLWPYELEAAYTDAVNTDVILVPSKGISAAIGTMKCNGFSGREVYEGGYNFWQVSVALEVDWQLWNKPILNMGTHEAIPDGFGDYYLWPIIGANGESVTDPVMLDKNGLADPFRENPIELPYKKYRPEPFAFLLAYFGL